MKKQISLAMVLMLSLVLSQPASVGAADAVNYNHTPLGVDRTISESVILTDEIDPIPTYPSSMTGEDLVSNIADSYGCIIGTHSVYIDLYQREDAYVTFHIGVPATAYYDVQAKLSSSNGDLLCNDGVTGTFDSGQQIRFNQGAVNGSAAWTSDSSPSVLLEQGDHTVTFTSGDLCSHVYFYGLQIVADPSVTPPDPSASPSATPDYSNISASNAPYAGVYRVTTDKAVTLTNETGHTVTLAANETAYFYLIKGNNNIIKSDATATVTFAALANNGLTYYSQVDPGTAPLAADKPSALELNMYIAPGDSVTFTAPITEAGIYYIQLQLNDTNTNLMYLETDTGFYGTIQQYQWGWHYRTSGPSSNDLLMVYFRAGDNTVTVENQGGYYATLGAFRACNTKELDNPETFPQYADQLNMESCTVVAYQMAEQALTSTASSVDADELTFVGKVAAEYQDAAYGVEFSTNKAGTRAQRYYGAKSGDTVSDGAGGTRVFSFNDWDGSFEIILQNVSTGTKTFRFFVGSFYTDEANVTIAAE